MDIIWIYEMVQATISFVYSDAIHPYANDMLSIRELVMTLDNWVPHHKVSQGNINRFLTNDRQALLAAIEETRADNFASMPTKYKRSPLLQ